MTCEGRPPQLYAQTIRGGFITCAGRAGDRHGLPLGELGGTTPVAARLDPARHRRSGSRTEGIWRRVETVRAAKEAESRSRSATTTTRGTLDVLRPATAAVFLLANRARPPSIRSDRASVYPASAAAASFVDYDNDGRLDVSLAPQGLYRWDRRPRPLRPHRCPQHAQPDRLRDRRVDGLRQRRPPRPADRDLEARVLAEQPRRSSKRNVTRGGHWLEVDLSGVSAQSRGDRGERPDPAPRRPHADAVGRPERRRAPLAGPLPPLLRPRQDRGSSSAWSSAGRAAARPGCARSGATGCCGSRIGCRCIRRARQTPAADARRPDQRVRRARGARGRRAARSRAR